MNILLDESAPRLIKTRLAEFSVSTVQEMGWTGLKNGELLTLAEQQFDAFITADQQLRYQQNLAGRRLAILVLPSNQVPMVTRLLPMIAQTLREMAPGGSSNCRFLSEKETGPFSLSPRPPPSIPGSSRAGVARDISPRYPFD